MYKTNGRDGNSMAGIVLEMPMSIPSWVLSTHKSKKCYTMMTKTVTGGFDGSWRYVLL